MIRSIMILVLLTSITTYKCYSQKLSASLLKEINLRIAEGIECKKILAEKDNQVSILENLSNEQAGKIDNLNKQITLLQENNVIGEGRERAAMQKADECAASKEKAEKDVVRLKKGRNTWRLIAGIETVVLVGIGYLILR